MAINNKLFKKITLVTFSIFFLLLIVLVIHVYTVTHKALTENEKTQLSRIDFKQKIDSTQANQIQSFVTGIEGVKTTYFNIPDGILVYSFIQGKQTSENVFNLLMNTKRYKAERYIVTAEQAKTGCPAGYGANSSVMNKIMNYFKK